MPALRIQGLAKQLDYLDLSRNPIGGEGLAAIAVPLIENSTRLGVLRLSRTGLSDQEGRILKNIVA